MFGPRLPAETLERLWMMLAHSEGGILNASRIAASLGVSVQTVNRYIDLLVDLAAGAAASAPSREHREAAGEVAKDIRQGQWFRPCIARGRRFQHAGLAIRLPAPVGEGLRQSRTCWHAAPERTVASFYRTSAGAEIDLLLQLPGGGLWAIEIKRGSAPRLDRGFHNARGDLNPDRAFVVYFGEERYPTAEGVEAIGTAGLAALLRDV